MKTLTLDEALEMANESKPADGRIYLACTELPGEDETWLLCRNVTRQDYGNVVELVGSVDRSYVEAKVDPWNQKQRAYVPRYEPAIPGTLLNVDQLVQWVPDVLVESLTSLPASGWKTAGEVRKMEAAVEAQEKPAPAFIVQEAALPPVASQRWPGTLAIVAAYVALPCAVAVGPLVREWVALLWR